ncbi:hypothetical protein EDB69_4033 [Vibrio crassostreae]|uniref:hypothetical protein n=1 Tax=Vibrio crassostreae TaxID=246167 RepID=UPI000F4DDE92|nr:hypothetical protein [Vibrio crassostreae]RPE87964.1 hypothetical protein EDB68_4110 [Vibrio crassostreae]RPF12325.1 hypothetical protein EDB69_4033 [Vibrio crassostreae]
MLRTVLLSLALFVSAFSYAGEGEFSETLIDLPTGSLVQNYDVFTENNKEYVLTFKEADKKWGQSFSLSSKENSKAFTINATMGRGDGRYSKPRSGSFQFKFDNDDKVYNFSGTSYYLRTVFSYKNKEQDKEFLQKLANKNYVYVKVIVVGVEHVFKVKLTGSKNMLQKGKYII